MCTRGERWSERRHGLTSLHWVYIDEVYVDEIYDHTRPSTVVCMSSMQVYVEFMVILIIYIL
jgi:hypothetical protein